MLLCHQHSPWCLQSSWTNSWRKNPLRASKAQAGTTSRHLRLQLLAPEKALLCARWVFMLLAWQTAGVPVWEWVPLVWSSIAICIFHRIFNYCGHWLALGKLSEEAGTLPLPLALILPFRLLLPEGLDFSFCTGHWTVMGQGFLSPTSAIPAVLACIESPGFWCSCAPPAQNKMSSDALFLIHCSSVLHNICSPKEMSWQHQHDPNPLAWCFISPMSLSLARTLQVAAHACGWGGTKWRQGPTCCMKCLSKS